MLSEANFLILDEPTNHLDITSKEVLEQAINEYTGTVLYVSHDRYFINKTADRILELTDETMINYLGDYDYYLIKKPDIEKTLLSTNSSSQSSYKSSNTHIANTSETPNQAGGKLDWQKQKEEQARLRKLQNKLKSTEDKISNIEDRSTEIDNLLTQEEIYTNVEKLVELQKEKNDIEHKLEKLLTKWEHLAAQLSE